MVKNCPPAHAMVVHGTCVAYDGFGILLRGAPGAGKSDLALRLIDGVAGLVADDQVVFSTKDGRLVAAAPEAISGRIEVRGFGIVEIAATAEAPLVLIVDLVPPEEVERLPEPGAEAFLGHAVPRLALAPFEASAAAKVRLAVLAVARDSKADS